MKAFDRFSVDGRVAIVTGGGGGGGRALSAGLAGAGASVVVASRSLESCEATASVIRDAGGQALAVTVDVSVADERGRLIERTIDRFGRLDVVVNNAAVLK